MKLRLSRNNKLYKDKGEFRDICKGVLVKRKLIGTSLNVIEMLSSNEDSVVEEVVDVVESFYAEIKDYVDIDIEKEKLLYDYIMIEVVEQYKDKKIDRNTLSNWLGGVTEHLLDSLTLVNDLYYIMCMLRVLLDMYKKGKDDG